MCSLFQSSEHRWTFLPCFSSIISRTVPYNPPFSAWLVFFEKFCFLILYLALCLKEWFTRWSAAWLAAWLFGLTFHFPYHTVQSSLRYLLRPSMSPTLTNLKYPFNVEATLIFLTCSDMVSYVRGVIKLSWFSEIEPQSEQKCWLLSGVNLAPLN